VPNWGSERIRPVLDQLSYLAHEAVASPDGRGRLVRSAVREALIKFFETAQLPSPWEAARRCLDYFEQRSSLLIPDENETYVFAHLTLQEHCAGRYLVLHPSASSLLLKHRADDRWREPIFLGLGAIQPTKPELIDRFLTDLIDHDEDGHRKPAESWQRDLILAAEIGVDRDWNYLRTQQVNVSRLQRELKGGLVKLLQDRRQLLPINERVRAGLLLGDLGDPRFPVTIKEWQKEIARALKGDTSSYFCRVEPGTYIIGSAENDAKDEEMPQHTVTFDASFLIARYPITNAQWMEWVNAGGKPAVYMDDPDVNSPNKPVVGISSNVCNQFCSWLSQQTGKTVRLPNEREWEAAARGGGRAALSLG
jgi:hypothetical protein